jgi:hypothetical protein
VKAALFLHAEGVRCNSQGQCPWVDHKKRFKPCRGGKTINHEKLFRTFSASHLFANVFLGRCPRLLHFAPLALSGALRILVTHDVNTIPKILNRIRDARGGKLNSSVFGERMRGKGQYWDAQRKLFEVYVKRLGFNEHRAGSERHTRANTFRRPSTQGALFS